MALASTAPPANTRSRDALKSYFRSGSLPTEQHFIELIDSAVNRVDDGFGLDPDYGLQLAADPGQSSRLASFYPSLPDVDAENPAWFVELAAGEHAAGLSFSEAQPEDTPAGASPTSISRLHLGAGGQVGIGTTAPEAQLDVRGFVASQGRIGTYCDNPAQPRTDVPADGEWYSIVSNLDGLHAFEIVAAAYGSAGRGRYALTHATALSAFGKSHSRVFRKNAWFWGLFQKIQFRWTGELHNYGLEMRTASSFGAGSRIVYHITHLFDDRRPV